MGIQVLELLEGARAARGLVVVIDVFRAFTTACYAVACGARAILPIAKLEEAYALKREHPDWVLVGERGGRILAGFDYVNSPTRLHGVDLAGRTVILTTSSGTQGLVAAKAAPEVVEVVTGSFVNAAATAAYLRARLAEEGATREVSLVAMGVEAVEPALEDQLCAEYIRRHVSGGGFDETERGAFFEAARPRLAATTGLRFLDGRDPESMPPSDFDVCLRPDLFNFVLRYDPPYLNAIASISTAASRGSAAT